MESGVFAAIAYGILSLVGGIMGYAKVESKISLISGIISGVLLILGGVLQLQGVGAGLPKSADCGAGTHCCIRNPTH